MMPVKKTSARVRDVVWCCNRSGGCSPMFMAKLMGTGLRMDFYE
jgi:hypothetical protein